MLRKLAAALSLLFCVITDWDPTENGGTALGATRALGLIDTLRGMQSEPLLTAARREELVREDKVLRDLANEFGIFLNDRTFETEVAATPNLLNALLDILDEEDFGPRRRARIQSWRNGEQTDENQLLAMVADIGKGRLASRLADR